ncbi:pirin family protein [Geodermatophilus sp. SYSU D00815]
MSLEQRVVAAPDDGSLGPLLRLADDRLGPGEGYGRHDHRAVDVVAVVLAGSLRHAWREGAGIGAGDVAVLRSGTGLTHDEVAGDDGARVLQAYLRAADPAAPPSHEVHRGPRGWVDLGRDDARLWVGPPAAAPEGQVTVAGEDLVAVWRLATTRPDWAAF